MAGNTYFNLDRFVAAQASVYPYALNELHAGCKHGHWMWFIFPQLQGLGLSPMAELFGLPSLEHARQYLAHPILGPRLAECTRAVNALEGRSLEAVFGSPDHLKFRSSMTLFALAEYREHSLYREAIDRMCAGLMDEQTLSRLEVSTPA